MQLTAYGEIPEQAGRLLAKRPGVAQSSIWLGMKLTAVLIVVAFLQVSAKGLSQGITLNVRKASLEKVMSEIERQSGYHFLYTKTELDKARAIDVSVTDVDLITALTACFQDQPFQYAVVGNNIVLNMPPVEPTSVLANFFHLFRSNPPPGKFRGKIVNDQGKPMEDASVLIKGTNRHVYADKSGIFEIDGVTPGMTLVISYPGFTEVEYNIKSLERPAALDKILPAGVRIYVVLQPSKSGLDEMQVIAYGKVSKRLNTGSVVTIKAEDIEKNPVNNVLQALQGRVPGMLVQQGTGAPGGNFLVQVRGQSSFGLTQPLFVIDGVVYPANTALAMLNPAYNRIGRNSNSGLNGSNILDYFDPNLIESVEVLKDADATAIYGSRGAYGVILITTKKGRPGIPRININSYTGVTTRGLSPRLVNTQQYLMLRREAFANDGATPGPTDYDLNGTFDTTAYTNWRDVFVGTHALTSSTSASYSGGLGTTSFLIGGNFKRQNSIQRNIGAQTSGGLNFNVNTGSANQKFNLTVSGSYSSTVNNMVPGDLSGSAATIVPNAPPLYLPNGKLDWRYNNNPAALYYNIYNAVTNNLLSTAVIRYTPVRGLTVSASVGYNYLTMRELYGQPSSTFNPANGVDVHKTAMSSLQLTSTSTINFDPYINYNTNIASKGKLDLLAGLDMQSGMVSTNTVTGTSFSTDALIRNPAAGVTVSSLYTTNPNRQAGYFLRANFVWDRKYVIDLNGRYDGSTKFGPNSQFGKFGAVGAAWIFSEERWIKHHLGFLSFGKLRGSYGITGGDAIPNYAYLSQYVVSSNGYEGSLLIIPNNIANPELHWETNKKKEIALELRFLNERIWLEGSYYNNRSSNQLLSLPLSIVTGFGGITQNSPALIQNSGFEGMLTTYNFRNKNFVWKTSINITINRNRLLKYPDNNGVPLISVNPNYVIGKSLQNTKVYKYAGIDPKTGQYNFTNAKGETGPFTYLTGPVQLDPIKDKYVDVDPTPKYYAGIDNSFSYKGFTLDFLVFINSRKGLNYYGQQTFSPGVYGLVPTVQALDRWQKPGDIAKIPKLTQNGLVGLLNQFYFQNSTGAYSSATYARLQNVSISYSFSAARLKKARINGLTIYLQGQNLLTISPYKDLDPENMAPGSMGPYKVYTAGINITL
jgi:TonB-linked SusC/RagA family outer membrane protein